jgi:hypothetical protein
MNIRTAIKEYKQNIELTLNGEKDFKFVNCDMSCNCIIGIRWCDMSFVYGRLKVKNGFEFKLSMNLENILESFYYAIIKNYDEIQTKLDREKRLKELGL